MSEPEPGPDLLSLEDLLEVAAGVLDEVVVRDQGLLASAADRPRASVFGEDAYPRLVDKAAALMHSLARLPVDGDKGLAWSATRVLLLLNGRDIDHSVDDAEALVLAVATGQLDVPRLAASIAEHLR